MFLGNSSLFRHDKYGLAATTEPTYACTDKLLPLSSPPASTIIDAIKKKGCRLYIGCRCSKEGEGGITYYRGGLISVIVTYPSGGKPRLDQLVHELVHARDFCDGWVKDDCKSHVCTELKAYAAELKIGNPYFYQQLKEYGLLAKNISEHAAGSAKDYCSSEREATTLGIELFKECVGDGDIY